jgi:hypothetical protein
MLRAKSQEDEDDCADEQPPPPIQQQQQQQNIKWGLQSQANEPRVHQYTGGDRGKKQNETPHINKDSSPLSIFMLYFVSVIDLLVTETNRYSHQYLDRQDKTPTPLPDIMNSEMFLFLAITVQMGHDIHDRLRDCWTRTEQFFALFYPNTMTRDHFLHILCYLHFTDNDKEIDHNDVNYDRLWKIREIFNILNVAYSKFYNPSKHLVIDEVIVLFKRRVVFKHYIPKKYKQFGIKIFKLCDATGYTYDMEVYLGKDRQRARTDMTATPAMVKQLTRRVKGHGHKLYMDNYFSSPDLYDDLTKQKINCCGTVRPHHKGMPDDFRSKTLRHGHKLFMDNYFSSPDLYNDLTKQKINCCGTVRPHHKGMPEDFRSKIMRLKWGDIRARINGDLTAVVGRTNMTYTC